MPPPHRTRIVILGAAGRDFHDFNTVFRDDPACEVVAFTAAQIPGIAGRRYPPALAGPLYPQGIPIEPEDALEALVRDGGVERVVFAYSDVSHEHVMHLASRALAAGADFALLGPGRTALASARPVVAVCAVLPAVGYGAAQIADLAATIDAVPCDVVLLGTPLDLRRSLTVRHPIVRVRYGIREREPGTLEALLGGL